MKSASRRKSSLQRSSWWNPFPPRQGIPDLWRWAKKNEKIIRFCFIKKKSWKKLVCVVTGFARPVPGDWYEGGGQGVTQAAYRERPKRGFGRRWCESKSKKNENLKNIWFCFKASWSYGMRRRLMFIIWIFEKNYRHVCPLLSYIRCIAARHMTLEKHHSWMGNTSSKGPFSNCYVTLPELPLDLPSLKLT